MKEEMKNCAYCSEGALLDVFGIKIGELPMSKVILFKEQSHHGRVIVACKKHVDDITMLSEDERKQYMEMPVRVEYTLTKKAESIVPILLELKKWGEENL